MCVCVCVCVCACVRACVCVSTLVALYSVEANGVFTLALGGGSARVSGVWHVRLLITHT